MPDTDALDALRGRGPPHHLGRRLRHLARRRPRRPLPPGRRRALLGEGAGARRHLPLLTRRRHRPLGGRAGRAARVLAGGDEHPAAPPGGRREGPLDAPALRARRRADDPPRDPPRVESAQPGRAARGGARARRRQDRRPGRRPVQAGPADGGGVRGCQAARRPRRRDGRGRPDRHAGPLDPQPPRALGRGRLSRRPSAAPRSPPAPGSSRSPTRGT